MPPPPFYSDSKLAYAQTKLTPFIPSSPSVTLISTDCRSVIIQIHALSLVNPINPSSSTQITSLFILPLADVIYLLFLSLTVIPHILIIN